jgi:adenylate cyclase
VLRRVLEAWRGADVDALRNLHSQSSSFRSIGTDPDEWWGVDDFMPVAAAQVTEIPPFQYDWDDVEGFELGPVGWGAARGRFVFESGEALPMRFTAVMVIEGGVWRCVQTHVSVPVENEETLGVTLTRTLDDLLDSLDPPALALLDQTEGTATLMFTDIEGSTAMAAQLGDREWGRIIEAHDRTLEEVVARHGGRIIKTLGDGALVSFGSARPAVRCAGDLQKAFASHPFEVRIGIHAGDVVRTSDDVIGTTVNKAARVAAAASGGQVVVSSLVRELIGATPEFAFGETFLVELKGLEGAHELVPVKPMPAAQT